MKDEFRKVLDDFCHENARAVRERIEATIRRLHNTASSPETETRGPGNSSPGRDLGKFGARTIDVGKLSAIVSGIKTLDANSESRKMDFSLCALQFDAYKNDPEQFKPLFLGPGKPAGEIKTACSEFLNSHVDLFRAFRRADLLLNHKYNPAIHDESLEKLSWQRLKAEELKLIPPVVIELSVRKLNGELTATIQDILTTGVPLKLALFLERTEEVSELEGRETALQVSANPGFMALFLRGVYVCQISAGSQHPEKFSNTLKRAFLSGRPALLSLLDEPQAEARLANTSRTFVHLVYDPDASGSFQKCIDISDNPDLQKNWGYDEEGFDFTPAHYLLRTGRFDHEFRDGSNVSDKISLKEFFGGKNGTPVIVSQAKEYVISNGVMSFCANHIDNWNTLRSLAGIDNPQLIEAIAETRRAAEAEKATELERMQQELTAKYESARQQSMKSVMRNLVIKLLAISTDGKIPLKLEQPSRDSPESAPTDPTSAAAKQPAPPGQVASEPWLETDMCTACDECITINGSIFAYNADKLAYIKNPNGGPYRDLVKAAEKCSAGIIHPGLPLNPADKDVDKWIKRAAKYN